MSGSLFVGYARETMNPPDGTPLGGYGNLGKDRLSIGKVHFDDDDLYFTVIAVSDENGETVLLCTLDIVRVRRGISLEMRKRMSEKTGVPVDNIFLCATHTHSSPEVVDGYDAIEPWLEIFYESGVVAASEAMEDRKKAEIFVGKKKVYEMNFVRRYMKNGEFLGTNKPKGDSHENPADNDLQMINFRREDAPDIIMVNWGAHPDYSWYTGTPHGTPGFHRGISADYIYTLRKFTERATGAKFAFFQAAAGNLNPMTLIPSESLRVKNRKASENSLAYIAYGNELSEEVISLYRSELERVNGGAPRTVHEKIVFDLPEKEEIGSPVYNKALCAEAAAYGTENFIPTEESRLAARLILEEFPDAATDPEVGEIVAVLKDGGSVKMNARSDKLSAFICKKFGFSSIYAASSIIDRAKKLPSDKVNADISACAFGDVGFAFPPYEMFDTNGVGIKKESPFAMTFVCEYTNDSVGYLPSALACSHGGYEVDTMETAAGSAEKAEGRFVAMLDSLFENN